MSIVSSAMRRALLRRHVQRAHVVQPVGELDQQHAHVVGDGEQQLAQVFRLLGLLRDEVELLDLGQALDQAPISSPNSSSISARVALGVLDGVVQQGGGDGRVVELASRSGSRRLRADAKYRDRRSRASAAMFLHGIDIGAC
jgi:hypothetical protein